MRALSIILAALAALTSGAQEATRQTQATAAAVPESRRISISQTNSPVTPLLIFLQPTDALEPVGVLTFEANAVAYRGPITAVASEVPPAEQGRGERGGIQFRPLLAVPQPEGGCVVFGCTSEELPGQPKNFRWRLYRARTPDGYHFSDVKEVYHNPKGPWLIEASMVRQATTGRLFFYPWSRSDQPEVGHALWGFVSGDGRNGSRSRTSPSTSTTTPSE